MEYHQHFVSYRRGTKALDYALEYHQLFVSYRRGTKALDYALEYYQLFVSYRRGMKMVAMIWMDMNMMAMSMKLDSHNGPRTEVGPRMEVSQADQMFPVFQIETDA